MRSVLLLLLAGVASAQNITVTPSTTYQTLGGWFATPQWPDLLHTTTYYAAAKNAVDQAMYGGDLFRMNGIQIPVYPGDFYQDQDYFSRFRAGTLVPSTSNYANNYASCPVQGGTNQDSLAPFIWDNFVAPMIVKANSAGTAPVIEFRFTWNNESGTGPNCTGGANVPAWWTDSVYATGWVNYFASLISTGRTTLSEVNSGRYYVSIINEPNFNTFRSNYYTNARMGSAAVALRSALNTAGYTGVKIICCEWEDLGLAPAGIPAVYSAAGSGIIDVWAAHLYHNNTTANYDSTYAAAQAAGGAPVWQLEWFNGGITSLHGILKSHWAGYEKFADGYEALGTCGQTDDYGMIAVTSTSCAEPFSNPVYRAKGGSESQTSLMAPYFNLLKRGAVGLGATTDNNNYDPVAFLNPDGAYIANIWVKATGTTSTVNVSGLPVGTYTWKYTKDNSNVLITGGVLSCGGVTACSAAIPGSVSSPGAILSFIGPAGPLPSPQTYYVSTTGSSGGTGSISSPWDLATAVAKTSLTAGSTIYLRGGTYYGRLVTAVAGTSGNPITIRSYPGEWAIIDGNVTGTLAANLSSASTATTCQLTTVGSFPNSPGTGFQAVIDTEILGFNNPAATSPPSWTNCIRGLSGSTAVAAHTAGATVYMTGAILDISGSDTIWRDLEIRNSSPASRVDLSGNNSLVQFRQGDAVVVHAARTKVINCVIHDGLDGLTAWKQAPDSEFYGNIIYNNGVVASDRAHGHSMYHENETGTREILANIAQNSFGGNAQMYGVTGAFVGGHLKNNVFAGAGNYDTGLSAVNLIVGTQTQPIPSVTVENNYLRLPSTSGFANVQLGFGGLANNTMTFQNNYVAGGIPGTTSPWTTLTFAGNTMYGAYDTIFQATVSGTFSASGNSYYDQTPTRGCGSKAAFGYNGGTGSCGGNLTFAEWKTASGQDASSSYTQAKPANTVFVTPNVYQNGRGNIVIYNWTLSSSVSVDLSSLGLQNSQPYQIRNAACFLSPCAPVLTGVYSASSPVVSIPMNSAAALAVAQPYGMTTSPVTSFPEFGALVVVPSSAPPMAAGAISIRGSGSIGH